MQPAVNIVIRTLRNTREHLMDLVHRESLNFSDQEQVSELIRRVNESFQQDIARAIQRAYPKHSVTTADGPVRDEKSDSGKKNDKTPKSTELTWHLNPVHNTVSLVRCWNDWGLSLTAERDGEIEHAIYYEPATGDEYTASKGKSAARDDRRIRISPQADLSLALLSVNVADTESVLAEKLGGLAGEAFSVRRTYNAPLALLQAASNQSDAALLARFDPEECAAAAFIAREAGALLTRFDGTPLNQRSSAPVEENAALGRTLICANPKLTKAILGKLKA